jgi:hypothetical protein
VNPDPQIPAAAGTTRTTADALHADALHADALHADAPSASRTVADLATS